MNGNRSSLFNSLELFACNLRLLQASCKRHLYLSGVADLRGHSSVHIEVHKRGIGLLPSDSELLRLGCSRHTVRTTTRSLRSAGRSFVAHQTRQKGQQPTFDPASAF
jgi:hypothetical protein